jgi:OOP family OmpA-OmpF porin
MSQMNQDDDQNYVLGIVGAIILAILVGVVSLTINASDSMNTANQTVKTEIKNPFQLGNFDFSVSNGKITLAGEVVDEKAKLSLLNPARLLWGNDNVVNQLVIKPDAQRFWWNVKPFEVLAKLKAIPQFSLHLENKLITGEASVGSEEQKSSFLVGLTSWFTSDTQTNVTVNVDPQLSQDSIDANTLLNLQIEYATGISEVPDAVKPILNQIADILKNDLNQVSINGHTDNVGNPEENKVLSLARADKIKSYLVSQGVDLGQLKSSGFGDTKPIADNNSDVGKAKNRRIEFSAQ